MNTIGICLAYIFPVGRVRALSGCARWGAVQMPLEMRSMLPQMRSVAPRENVEPPANVATRGLIELRQRKGIRCVCRVLHLSGKLIVQRGQSAAHLDTEFTA